ncbi:MAG: ornithine cyclodeaminase family protein [Chloroflexi bacterium RBG_13_53_26]|jgi:alanine dehydrogenase|nr:MAG: ornithine cyclodeaminase family protein [Chloroflexi bacterium RBG_13_53_26]
MSTLLLGKKEVAELLDMGEVMRVVEQAFRDYASGCAQMPAKVYIRVPKGDFRAMPAAVPNAVGVKWVNVHLSNHERGLPSIMGILILSDPDTAYPLAIMDATEITAYRTAATSANASRYLARPESRTLGLIGAGRQACMHLQSHALVFPLKKVRVYDIQPQAAEAFVRRFPQFYVEASSAEEAAMSDIVCTLTPSTAPVVKSAWIKSGTHINAVGADAPGKQELDPTLLSSARVVVDDLTQACHAGEINVPLRQGLFRKEQVWATLGEIITGCKTGRRDGQEITIFDSTGLAIEDVATAWLIYQRAKERGGYQSMDIV